MIIALILGTLLFLAALAFHMWMLRLARRFAPPQAPRSTARTMGGQLIVLLSHMLVAILFAVGFWMAVEIGLGSFAKEASMGWMDYYYYSLINITTVGLGEIYPTGHLRVLTGIESLTGFMIISCTAQFVYQSMKEQEG